MKRRPLHTLLITSAIIVGVFAGIKLVKQHTGMDLARRSQATLPAVDIEHAQATELVRQGFRLSGKEPASWSDISLRLRQDGSGSLTCLRCTIAPDEADRLIVWPPGSRCPMATIPPSDWPWGKAHENLSVPDWWRPVAGRVRIYEQAATATSAAVGIFASFDPTTRLLHLWQWQRAAWKPNRPSPLGGLTADGLATALVEHLRRTGQVADAQGWFQAITLPPAHCGLDTKLMPAGMETLSAALLPIRGRHRYLMAIHGIDEESAWRLVAEQPLQPLADDGALPVTTWSFALPATGLPAWFKPGPGPRRGHHLVRVGSGSVEAARWVAFDRAARTLYIWDWEDLEGRDAGSDIANK